MLTKIAALALLVSLSGSVEVFLCDENKLAVSDADSSTCTVSHLNLLANTKLVFSPEASKKTVVFRNSIISTLPASLFEHIQAERLFIEASALRDLVPYSFKAASALHELHARDNRLTKLEEKTFVGAKSLELLDLSYNSLEHIDDNAFEGLRNLQSLNLKHNYLKVYRNDWFRHSSSFRFINLAQNFFVSNIMNLEAQHSLTHLDVSSIDVSDKMDSITSQSTISDLQLKLNCSYLQNIDVSGNQNLQFLIVTCKNFSLMDVNVIADGTKLGSSNPSLILDGRLKLVNLDVDATAYRRYEELSSFKSLKRISLQKNDLGDIHSSFQLLTDELEYLSLSGNSLHALNGTIMQKFKNLKVLDLSRSGLSEKLDFAEFKGLLRLEELYLNDNGLQSLNGIEMLKAFPSLRFVNLRGNDFDDELLGYLKHLLNAGLVAFTF